MDESMISTSVPSPSSVSRPNDKERIAAHYDIATSYYRSLWGEHLHHGYWIRGNESKEEAQEQLIEHLAGLSDLKEGSRLLDIGCGIGASSLYLARKHHVRPTGITISPAQVEMARNAAAEAKVDAEFLLMDAEAMHFAQPFDILWSIESISHYYDRKEFFRNAAPYLKPGGVFAFTDWFKRPGLSAAQTRKHIAPIERGMLCELETMDDYESYLVASGFAIEQRRELTQQCAKTWDLGLNIIADKALWALAAKVGMGFLTYLNAFRFMRAGFLSGNFVYGLFVALKAKQMPLQTSLTNRSEKMSSE
jgi:tocopherol O-methyltransferase